MRCFRTDYLDITFFNLDVISMYDENWTSFFCNFFKLISKAVIFFEIYLIIFSLGSTSLNQFHNKLNYSDCCYLYIFKKLTQSHNIS
jgi:hypothetical protein